MTGFRQAVWDLASAYQPLTGRQLYYQAVVAGLVDKDEGKSRANECYRPRYLDVQRLNCLWTIRHSSTRIAGNLIT